MAVIPDDSRPTNLVATIVGKSHRGRRESSDGGNFREDFILIRVRYGWRGRFDYNDSNPSPRDVGILGVIKKENQKQEQKQQQKQNKN